MDEQAYRQAEERLWTAFGLEPTERRVRLPRLGVEVRVQEVGTGEPVLYLHGGPNAGSTWAPLVAEADGFRSLLLDRPGTGLSEPLAIDMANVEQVADAFVTDVMDALGIQRAHVVASSFGGFLALRSAAATPERLGRMVQMGCPAGAPGMGMPAFMKAMVTPGLGRVIQALPPNEKAGRMTLRQIGHAKSLRAGRIPKVFFEWYLALQRHTDTMANDTQLISAAASLRGWHPSLALPAEVLSYVTTPTYLLWGADDTFGGEDVARRLSAALPDATLEMLPDAGHLPWLDAPARAAAVVEGFLRQPTTSASVRASA